MRGEISDFTDALSYQGMMNMMKGNSKLIQKPHRLDRKLMIKW